MLGGIIFQTCTYHNLLVVIRLELGISTYCSVAIIVFCFFTGEFLLRYIKDKPVSGKTRERGAMYPRLRIFTGAVMLVLLLLFVR